MKDLSKILVEFPAQGEVYSTNEEWHGAKTYYDKDFYKAVNKWLKEFKKYLPPATASEHAKGAHDAVNDLKEWINHKGALNVKDSTVEG